MTEFFAQLLTVENGIALVTLTALEIVLGIDNIVFIAILSGKLPPEHQRRARRIGLSLAMGMRVLLLLGINWVMGLTETIATIPWFVGDPFELSGRDLILLTGGLFLLAKATYEIHDKIEGEGEHGIKERKASGFVSVIAQILALDIVFSLDSVITAVGMADSVAVMIVAVIIAVGVMLIFADTISDFVERHPTIKMLALSFLVLIGVMLVVEGLHQHIPKGYIYFAMAFSLIVELLNLRVRKISRASERIQPKA